MTKKIKYTLIILSLIGILILNATASLAATNSTNTPVCGDKVCETPETLNSCPKDCTNQITDYAACVFDENRCINEHTKTQAINIFIIIFVTTTLIYLRKKKFI